jgi:hypothetical protein
MRGQDSLLCFELSSPHNYATALQAEPPPSLVSNGKLNVVEKHEPPIGPSLEPAGYFIKVPLY